MSVNAPIRVCVLEGLYAQLLRANFLLSLAVELQTCGLHLDSAKWSICYTDSGFSAFICIRVMLPNHIGVEGEENLYLARKLIRALIPSAMRVNYLTSMQPVNRETSLIDDHEHQRGTTSPSLSLVTPMQMSSRRKEVDAYANIPSVVANSSISGCVESVKPDCVSLSSGLSDQKLATDYELSNNENERTDSDSSIDNNLDYLCTAKSTELKLKDNIPGFEYIIKTGHHGWL